MFYRLNLKKGNITVILIGLISVMILMVAAMSRRMTSHTQLLTLSDYTQISRYFLESYVGDIMQQLRYASNEPTSKFSEEICASIDDSDTEKDLSLDFYSPSKALKNLADELKIDCTYKPKLTIVNTEPMTYPTGMDAGPQSGKEKIGLIQLTCDCKFQKRKYNLTVQYPFKVVFRVTPVLKDFMLFVDNMAKEQRTNDNINLLKVDDDGMAEEQDLRDGLSYDIRPLVLLPPLFGDWSKAETTGKVYLGPSDAALILNLAGGKSDSVYSDTFLVTSKDFGIETEEDLEEVPIFTKRNLEEVKLRGTKLRLVHKDTANLGVMGFSTLFTEVFEGSAYKLEDFLGTGDDGYWGKIKRDRLGVVKAMSYSSALKILGFKDENDKRLNREIYGNVYGRFVIISFWQPYSAQGVPLTFDKNRSSTDGITALDYMGGERLFECEEGYDYRFFHSRIMSGEDWNPNLADTYETEQNKRFMPMNADAKSRHHRCFNENDFKPQDEFKVTKGFFDKFGGKWFEVARKDVPPDERLSTLEQRIGRTFANQEEFLEAVGYKEGKFKVNGVVYVKGDLNLTKDLNLSKDDCSGGIVIVEGNISLSNIYRGEKIDTRSFGLNESTGDIYRYWCDKTHKNYISQDKILTFVSLKGGRIELNGNVLLGVHLINLGNRNGSDDQITWNVRDKIIFYGAIACNRLNLKERLCEFGYAGRLKNKNEFDGPFFMYPPVLADKETSLAVEIMENMRGYELTSNVPGGNGN